AGETTSKRAPAAAPRGQQQRTASHPGGPPDVKSIIAVASGKGGVGKSTVAVNVALALKELNLRVGILDADIYGPSVPKLLGLHGRPQTLADNRLAPMRG